MSKTARNNPPHDKTWRCIIKNCLYEADMTNRNWKRAASFHLAGNRPGHRMAIEDAREIIGMSREKKSVSRLARMTRESSETALAKRKIMDDYWHCNLCTYKVKKTVGYRRTAVTHLCSRRSGHSFEEGDARVKLGMTRERRKYPTLKIVSLAEKKASAAENASKRPPKPEDFWNCHLCAHKLAKSDIFWQRKALKHLKSPKRGHGIDVNQARLAVGLEAIAPKMPKWKCPECGIVEGISNRVDVISHMKTVHMWSENDVKTRFWYCPLCDHVANCTKEYWTDNASKHLSSSVHNIDYGDARVLVGLPRERKRPRGPSPNDVKSSYSLRTKAPRAFSYLEIDRDKFFDEEKLRPRKKALYPDVENLDDMAVQSTTESEAPSDVYDFSNLVLSAIRSIDKDVSIDDICSWIEREEPYTLLHLDWRLRMVDALQDLIGSEVLRKVTNEHGVELYSAATGEEEAFLLLNLKSGK